MPEQYTDDYDPVLTQLFASSVGPAQIPRKPTRAIVLSATPIETNHVEFGGDNDVSIDHNVATPVTANGNAREGRKTRKRKRKTNDENDIEERYMRQLALQASHTPEKYATTKSGLGSDKGVAHGTHQEGDAIRRDREELIAEESELDGVIGEEPPRHETIAPDREDAEIQKASQTVFLANISTSTITSKSAKKTLMSHLTSFIPTLPHSNIPHALESFRFRSTAFAESSMPKKAAFISQKLMDTTTKSTNAYAVYTTQTSAREAAKRLNGTVILDRHLRVDSVAHPAKQDHRRSVFVGNLSFVDDTSNMDAAKDSESKMKSRKAKEAADVEEGLWRQFGKVGAVESVRVVRDKTTRVGKGFAYVQFLDANAVEKALSLNGKKFPPMLPRILRVTRAKSVTKTKRLNDRSGHPDRTPGSNNKPKTRNYPSSKTSSLSGRAKKLLGRAGAAQASGRYEAGTKVRKSTKSGNKRAETFKKTVKQK